MPRSCGGKGGPKRPSMYFFAVRIGLKGVSSKVIFERSRGNPHYMLYQVWRRCVGGPEEYKLVSLFKGALNPASHGLPIGYAYFIEERFCTNQGQLRHDLSNRLFVLAGVTKKYAGHEQDSSLLMLSRWTLGCE